MMRTRPIAIFLGVSSLALLGLYAADDALSIEHADCPFFGVSHDKIMQGAMRGFRNGRLAHVAGSQAPSRDYAASALTEAVASSLGAPPGTRTGTLVDPATSNTIDRYLFPAMAQANVTPAPLTNDYEFIRRVTLDLTGRIPTPDQVTSFVADTSSNKRATYIDSLLTSPQWVDKWTMYYGDFFQNNSRNTQIVRFPDGVAAFNQYVRDSLNSHKPYDQMVREIISAQGTDSYTQGELNWLVGGVVNGGPAQDIWDQQTANIADSFLGIAHVNCLLCHNGRGHLDSLSLWGSQTTRMQAWWLSSFLSHTTTPRTTVAQNVYYWGLADNPKLADYPLNTTTGNRPARQPVGAIKNVAPQYLFGGQTPPKGQNYRVALAQFVTSDFQFARATVNFMWAQFFGMGIVDPPDTFDPARLDPTNPPTAPWPNDPTQPWPLQPSNPQLLNALAQDFINSGYDIKALQREIANSQAYQLSSRYSGTWNPAWTPLFARKLVRRLWAEELHDAITQTSGVIPTYKMTAVYGTVSEAMQLPEPLNNPDGANGPVNNFLNSFLRGNRDDQPRRPDGSILQALYLMNDNFVASRVSVAKAPKTGLLATVTALPNDQAVNTLFLTVLSRYPTSVEMTAAMGSLSGSGAARNAQLENLLWSLYNKVDFVFNY
ncbi:MAG TPA: DUF1549 domain-containing protein [Bryobacteraceae bacterium]|nr:DUF1549 domain-containing protein [Bryobacteraceae bacterium]